jgi:hypothetical protein
MTPSRTAARSESTPSTIDALAAESRPSAEPQRWKDDPEKRELMIRLAAYSFYERRGFVSGKELEDWLRAEMEVDRQLATEPKADEAT